MVIETQASIGALLAQFRAAPQLQGVWAIDSSKGGVGKTTTAVLLAEALGKLGFRVLVIDLDPQANATDWIGLDEDNAPSETISAILTGGVNNKAKPDALSSAIGKSALENVDLAYGNYANADELAVAAKLYGEQSSNPAIGLRKALGTLDSALYDFVLLDCPPGAGVLRVMSLTVADHVICPVNSQVLARSGLRQLQATIENLIAEEIIPVDEIPQQHILMTMYGTRRSIGADLEDDLRAREEERKELEAVLNEERKSKGEALIVQDIDILESHIRRSDPLEELPSHHQGIRTYSPRSNAVADYEALALEMLGFYLENENGV